MAGDQSSGKRLTFIVQTSRHDGDRLDAGDIEAIKFSQHVVLTNGESFGGFFDSHDVLAHVDEANNMAGNTLRKCGDGIIGPFFQRLVPGEVKELGTDD